jgi:putative membrane protein
LIDDYWPMPHSFLELPSNVVIGAGEWGVFSPHLMLALVGHPLVHLNATLNALATLLLLLGLWQIKRGRELSHGRAMLAALFVSAMFLTSYLTYHLALQLTVKFTHPGAVKTIYLAILASHIVLAISVPFLAIAATVYGVRAVGWGRSAALPPEEKARNRAKHLKVVRWAFPIWLYVSVTGVVVYLMLYHLWPSAELNPTLEVVPPAVSTVG